MRFHSHDVVIRAMWGPERKVKHWPNKWVSTVECIANEWEAPSSVNVCSGTEFLAPLFQVPIQPTVWDREIKLSTTKYILKVKVIHIPESFRNENNNHNFVSVPKLWLQDSGTYNRNYWWLACAYKLSQLPWPKAATKNQTRRNRIYVY